MFIIQDSLLMHYGLAVILILPMRKSFSIFMLMYSPCAIVNIAKLFCFADGLHQ